MQLIDLPSLNFDDRPVGGPIDILLLHYTGMQSGDEAIARLRDPAARVSSHYVVDEDGSIICLVPEAKRAWHAGVSSWAGARDINARSIGIEIVNPGHDWGYRPFPEVQMQAVIALSQQIIAQHRIPASRVLGHSDVAPMRKQDPGELFNWALLASRGIGLWPKPVIADWDEATFLAALACYGYDVDGPAGAMPETARHAAILAFERHFRPQHLTGRFDQASASILNGLLQAAGIDTASIDTAGIDRTGLKA
ncbi:MAG: N-acetylmuramoyl-L-alanine amidase [Rhodospirillaceae bacterium]|nr:MAG: N-acetylmuramoyl-L-alanine amidase [Rhodospirillaceae bacterium]